jgi:ketosteroid isomerase-like protein
MARYDDTFVGRFLEPWNRHDVDGALALMTDDCVWEVTRGREPHGTLYTGQTAVRSAIVEAFKALPDVNYNPVRNSFGEDHVVVELLVRGRFDLHSLPCFPMRLQNGHWQQPDKHE